MTSSPYGKRGGTSVNAGKRAVTYTATLPDGRILKRRSYTDHGPTSVATALEAKNGYPASMAVWGSAPVAWEGDFGRLVATRVDK